MQKLAAEIVLSLTFAKRNRMQMAGDKLHMAFLTKISTRLESRVRAFRWCARGSVARGAELRRVQVLSRVL